MKRIGWLLVLLVPVAVLLPQRAWALRCGTHIVKQGDLAPQVREECGDPFYVGHYVGPPGAGVETPADVPVAAVTTEAWYYNFGPQRLMVRLEFSGGVLAREQTLGYGFVGSGGPCDFKGVTIGMSVADLIARGPCDFKGVTIGMSVADLIARCGLAPSRSRNPLAYSAYQGAQAPAWGETWIYPADGSRAAREIRLQEGRVTDVEVLH
ncbi:MAG: hypothetical protein OJF61_000172 [Rhodanobacteraceae bacterium]|jgi:hypothetical protein|nr:MAG: hypothetical protein OJF61_000172 [Rhodanobacteraceae bacterium]